MSRAKLQLEVKTVCFWLFKGIKVGETQEKSVVCFLFPLKKTPNSTLTPSSNSDTQILDSLQSKIKVT